MLHRKRIKNLLEPALEKTVKMYNMVPFWTITSSFTPFYDTFILIHFRMINNLNTQIEFLFKSDELFLIQVTKYQLLPVYLNVLLLKHKLINNGKLLKNFLISKWSIKFHKLKKQNKILKNFLNKKKRFIS